jgi:hypothetical protein
MSRILFDSNGLEFADGEAFPGNLLPIESMFFSAETIRTTEDKAGQIVPTSLLEATTSRTTGDWNANLLSDAEELQSGTRREVVRTQRGFLFEIE